MREKKIKRCIRCGCEFEAVTADACKPCNIEKKYQKRLADNRGVYKEVGYFGHHHTRKNGKKE